MYQLTRGLLMLFLGASLALQAPAALAGNEHGKGQGKHKQHKEHKNHKSGKHEASDEIAIRIGSDDRLAIRSYLSDHYRPNCPPGLAKKRNGCLPPGQAKKYAIGRPLAVDIWQPIPDDLFSLLSAAPFGHRYVMVDKDVLLISEATHKVVDAITLLSAVGR